MATHDGRTSDARRHTDGWAQRKATRRTVLKGAGTAGLIAATGAAGALAEVAAAPATAAQPELKGEQVFRVPFNLTALEPDPGLQSHLWEVQFTLFEGLVRFDEAGQAAPAMAERWEASEDGLTYTFHLRPDIAFSNGDPITAHDFVWTWRRNLDPQRPGARYAYVLNPVKNAVAFGAGEVPAEELGVVALDDRTLQVTLEQPAVQFLFLMAEPMAGPINRAVAEASDDWKKPGPTWVSGGPFTIGELVDRSHVTLVPNPHYFRDGPYLEHVDYLIGGTPLLAYENDELDFVTPGAEIDRVRNDPELSAELRESLNSDMNFWFINVRAPGMGDVRVRRGFALAIDRETLATVVNNELSVPNGGYLPIGMPLRNDALDYGYDPEQARALLAEAGYPDGAGFPQVTLLTRESGTEPGGWPEFLQDQWQTNLGISSVIDIVETGVFNQRREAVDNPPAFVNQGWSSSYNDPMQWLGDGIFSSDPNFRTVPLFTLDLDPYRHYADLAARASAEQDPASLAQLNAEIDAWMSENVPDWVKEYSRVVEEAKISLDPAQRQDALARAQQVLSDNVFAIPLVTTKAIGLLKPWVKDPFFHPLLPTRPLYMDMTYIQRA